MTLTDFIEMNLDESWNEMGSPGYEEWQSRFNSLGGTAQEIYNFGRFRAFEDMQYFLEKINNSD